MASRPVVAAQVAVRVVLRVQERELLAVRVQVAAEAQLARSESAGVPGGR